MTHADRLGLILGFALLGLTIAAWTVYTFVWELFR